MKKTTKQKLARYITPFMHKILTTFTFVLLTVAFSSSFANTDTTTISNFYQLKLEVEKLKFVQAQHKSNNYTPQIQALENQLNQLKNSFDASNIDVNRQFTHSKELIVRQDERIVDFNSHLFWSGILVTALLVLISVGGYYFSYKKAKIEFKTWVEEEGKPILMKEIRPILISIKEQIQENKEQIQENKRVYTELQKQRQGSPTTPLRSTSEKQKKKAEEQVKEIKNKPDGSQYSFDELLANPDHTFDQSFVLHLDSYHQGELEESLGYVDKASKISEIDPEQEAKALVNKGTILGELGDLVEAIETYDLIFKKFKDSAEITLLEKVAIALVDKGVILEKLDRLDEAIKTFDFLADEQFKDSTETTLLEKFAIALVNKGLVLNKLEKLDEAIKTFDLVERFKDSTETKLLENVAKALIGKGFVLNRLGKPGEAIETFDLLIDRFKDRTETTLSKQVAEAQKNKKILEQNL